MNMFSSLNNAVCACFRFVEKGATALEKGVDLGHKELDVIGSQQDVKHIIVLKELADLRKEAGIPEPKALPKPK